VGDIWTHETTGMIFSTLKDSTTIPDLGALSSTVNIEMIKVLK
jgi:hypothetical protein